MDPNDNDDDNNNNRRIVVLDDGETWSGSGYVCEVTDEAYEEICEGRKPRNMLDAGVTIIDYINEPPGSESVET
jgi:hypothetical protein